MMLLSLLYKLSLVYKKMDELQFGSSHLYLSTYLTSITPPASLIRSPNLKYTSSMLLKSVVVGTKSILIEPE